MPINYFLIILVGLSVGIPFTSLLKKISLRYNLLIRQGMPLIGGIGIWLSFTMTYLLIFFLYGSFSKEIIGIIVSSFIMLIFGIVDDWRELSILAKFLVQIIATSLLIFFGIRTQIVYIGGLINIVITFIWVIGITNAFNHLDVIDGLAGGTTVIVSFAFFIISVLNGDVKAAVLSLSLAVASFGFLFYNLPPAKLYMGNCGSHLLGFILAAIALIISYAPLERKVALISPLLILSLPIFDTAFLIFMRISKKKIPFKKSSDHLPLRFLALGYSRKKALMIILVWCLVFSLSGVAVSRVGNSLGIGLTAMVILISLMMLRKMGKVMVDD